MALQCSIWNLSAKQGILVRNTSFQLTGNLIGQYCQRLNVINHNKPAPFVRSLYTCRIILLNRSHWNSINRTQKQMSFTQHKMKYATGKRIPDNKRYLTDVVVYVYKNDNFFKYMSLCGIVMLVFWLNMGSFAITHFERLAKKRAEYDQEVDVPKSFLENTMLSIIKHKYSAACCCVILGCLFTWISWIYPQRSIHQLKLLAGGKNLEVATYYFMGGKKTFVIPLTDISFIQARQAKVRQIFCKMKNRRMHYVLEKKDAKFPEPEIFDQVVGLQRNLKKK